MKKHSISMVAVVILLTACGRAKKINPVAVDSSKYTAEQFTDLQVLRYHVPGFKSLILKQKELVYYPTQAVLEGRDILFDRNGKYNLTIRRVLEATYTDYAGDRNSPDSVNLTTYLKRVQFPNGIHHRYGSEKFVPGFMPESPKQTLLGVDASGLPLAQGQTVE